jgi:hypothetical protein
MKGFTEEELARSTKILTEATPLSSTLIKFVEEIGADMDVTVVAMGIAYAAGSRSIGVSLPSAIDLVRFFYKTTEIPRETH